MPTDKSHNLIDAGIRYLIVNYQILKQPCIALLISHHYRTLSSLAQDETLRVHHEQMAQLWLELYHNHPGRRFLTTSDIS